MKKAEQIERLKEIRRLYEVEKMNLREIAARFGVTWQAIHQKLIKAGVPLRQKSRVKEQTFRFNERKGNDKERFLEVLNAVSGKRLTMMS